ncbi:kinase-like protein [Aspergillus steynii IBT 23096]|uniref:Kinase-like protein n=1 Tax=Aspergillus steynii IBT 23096 TaxID=1392250 RepID=A0A2I2G7G1_9EURO|nr:kinase-like protein [Aspergillus steynii IBT 23096]PLB48820.1 kinase-like protein [Aspergillus steynii IBT 23096]
MTMTLPEDFHPASVIASCANPLPENIVSQYGKRIIKISDTQVVKRGPNVTKEEAENQRIAYDLVDQNIVRIPRVHGFFYDEQGWGYIVMEFIDGKIIDPLADKSAIEKVVTVLDHFSTLRHGTPGPLAGGPCRGLLFPETEDVVFDSVDGMERWFNSRLFAHNPTLNLQGFELVLCHLDIAPRNILWLEDGSLCLVDWASAGYYPRLFEFCAQWIIEGKDGNFNSLLLKSMHPLPDPEIAQKDALLWAWRNIQKYAFRSKSLPQHEGPRESTGFTPVPPPPMPEYPPDWDE